MNCAYGETKVTVRTHNIIYAHVHRQVLYTISVRVRV